MRSQVSKWSVLSIPDQKPQWAHLELPEDSPVERKSLNERTTVVVENDKIALLFRQIAGTVARRIVLYAKKDAVAKKGEDYGFIKFGSRVDVFFPIGTMINVEMNQVVKGNKTVLATY